MEFCLCVSLERLATLVLSIPEGVVERRTAVHPVRAFTSIGRDCVGCFVGTWKGDCLGSSSRGQPRGALPLHQVTQRQVIKFADPTRRSGHTTCYTRCIGVCASAELLSLLALPTGADGPLVHPIFLLLICNPIVDFEHLGSGIKSPTDSNWT